MHPVIMKEGAPHAGLVRIESAGPIVPVNAADQDTTLPGADGQRRTQIALASVVFEIWLS